MARPKSTSEKRSADESTLAGRDRDDPQPAYFLSLSLENVRCFGPKQTLDLSDGNGKPAPWTIIFGVNGTGKTTVLQSLLAFQKLGESGDGIDDLRIFYNQYTSVMFIG